MSPVIASSAAKTFELVAVRMTLCVDFLCSPLLKRWNVGARDADDVWGTPMRGLCQSTTPASDECRENAKLAKATKMVNNAPRTIVCIYCALLPIDV